MDLFGKYINGMDIILFFFLLKVFVLISDIRKVGFWINFNVFDYKEYIKIKIIIFNKILF